MTKEYFNRMKVNLVEVYKNDLCEESLADIDAATNEGELIGVLKKYAAFLAYKNIPKIDWIRTWWGDYRDTANIYGVYFDQTAEIVNPDTDIVVCGDSSVNITTTRSHIFYITLQDNAKAGLLAYGSARMNVRVKDSAETSITFKDRTAAIKIRKV